MSIKNIYTKVTTNRQLMAVVHTFWQAASGVLVAGLLASKSTSDVKGVIALAVATGLAALKNAYVYKKGL